MKIKLKNMINKTISLAVLFSISFSLCACNKNNESEDNVASTDEISTEETEVRDEISDSETEGSTDNSRSSTWSMSFSKEGVSKVYSIERFTDLSEANKAYRKLSGIESVSGYLFFPVLRSENYRASDTFGNSKLGHFTFNIKDGDFLPAWPENVLLNDDSLYDYYSLDTDGSGVTAYMVMNWKSSNGVEYRAFIDIYAYQQNDYAFKQNQQNQQNQQSQQNQQNNQNQQSQQNQQNNNNSATVEEDMHSYWGAIKPYYDDYFKVDGVDNTHLVKKNPPKILCFFKKSDAENCLTSFLNNKYLGYKKSDARTIKFEVKSDTEKVPKAALNTTDLGDIADISFENFREAPALSQLKNKNAPTAYIVAVWKEKTDGKYHVALADVYASRS